MVRVQLVLPYAVRYHRRGMGRAAWQLSAGFLARGRPLHEGRVDTTIVDCGLFTATRDPSEVVGGPKVVPQQMDRETAMVEQPDGGVQLGSVVP